MWWSWALLSGHFSFFILPGSIRISETETFVSAFDEQRLGVREDVGVSQSIHLFMFPSLSGALNERDGK